MQLPLLEVFEIAALNPIKFFWPAGVHLAAVQPLFKQPPGTVTGLSSFLVCQQLF